MAYPDDSYAPLPVNPWGSWDETPWASYGAPAQPAPLQPGLGIPVGVLEAAAPPQQEIEMPEMDMRPPDPQIEPQIGFPTNPDAVPVDEGDGNFTQSPVFQAANPTDSISGVGPLAFPAPEAPMHPGLGIPTSVLDGATAGRTHTLDPSNDLERPTDPTQDAAIAYANLNPYERALQDQEAKRKYDAEERKLAAEAAENDAIEAEENAQAHRIAITSAKEQRAQLEIDARKAAEEQVDPEKWWSDRSTGQKIAGFLAAIIGGLVQGRTGGRNSGLDMINQAIDRDIDAQKHNLSAKRAEIARRTGVNAEDFAIAKEDFYEAEKMRFAARERVKTQISAEMANYDINGRTYRELGQTYLGIDAQQKAGADATEAAFQKNWIEMYKLDQEDRKIAKLKDHGAGAGLGGLGGAKALKPDDVPQEPSYYAARGLVAPPTAMSPREYKIWQGLKEGSQKITTGESSMSREDLERGIPGLVDPATGKTFIARGTPEALVKLRSLKTGTKTAVDLMDEALRVRTGWTTNTGNSDERRKLAAIWGQAKLAAKSTFDLGAITESDVPLIEGALGTDDPSSWKDPEAGILTARRLLINRANREFEGVGYEGARWDIKAPDTRKPDETSEDRAFKRAQNRSVGDITAFLSDDENLDPAERVPGNKERLNKLSSSELTASGIPPTIRKQLDQWAVDARSADEAKSTKARAFLSELTTAGGNDAVKAAARAALDAANMPATESVGGPRGSVSYETVPPASTKRAR